ncbi:MAG TPA: UbiX family flavin prenyltransferase [Saprospiraceae bacterium]|nr:UbiX family flavin prenyltransferase [Saprospiraceae bacterium]
MRKIVVAITGSSGSIYAKLLLDGLSQIANQWSKVAVVSTENALINWEIELGYPFSQEPIFDYYKNNDFFAPFASGSARYDTMIVIPSSMGTLARIANGISDSLITRAADVMLKENRRLIVVPREMPFSLIHLRNMTLLAEAGALVCPAIPSFYSQPQTIEELAGTVVSRVLDLAGFKVDGFRWQES